MAKWAYQFTPHDQWDYDGVNENILIDIPIGRARPRKAAGPLRPQRLRLHHRPHDRRGAGRQAVRQPELGDRHRPEDRPADRQSGNAAQAERQAAEHLPDPTSAARTGSRRPSRRAPGLLYAGIFNICMDLTDHPQSLHPRHALRRHGDDSATPAPGGNWGEFIAWDPVTGKKVWSIPEKFMTMSGALATAGDLVFYGTADGWFRAVDARTGKVLWSQKLGSGIIAQPMTYLGPDGRQYVAVYRRRRRRRQPGDGRRRTASRRAAARSTSSRSTASRPAARRAC